MTLSFWSQEFFYEVILIFFLNSIQNELTVRRHFYQKQGTFGNKCDLNVNLFVGIPFIANTSTKRSVLKRCNIRSRTSTRQERIRRAQDEKIT